MDQFGTIERRTGVTRYHQVYTMLSQALIDGAIPAGSALPSEVALMRLYKVGRNTIRRALGRLEREQRIVRRRGSGTYARDNGEAHSAWTRLSSMLFDYERYAVETSANCRVFKRTDTPAMVLQRAADFGPRCLEVEVLRSFEKKPFALSTSYVAERAIPKLTRRQLGGKAVIAALSGLGFAPATAVQITRSIAASATTAKLLRVPLGAPLLLTETITRDAYGLPLEFNQCAYRSDAHPLQLQLRYESNNAGLTWQAIPLSSPC